MALDLQRYGYYLDMVSLKFGLALLKPVINRSGATTSIAGFLEDNRCVLGNIFDCFYACKISLWGDSLSEESKSTYVY